ncbi:tetraacyldisaccharide 4'-kinase [Olivibacter ginsenosidimutans]|uniref:Tetraacyldisaccharide 4'-kinase n=1 Tax=Olivibacter ginsenosidimutans TaxID=1176537 RepID=A0ABP9BN44_9SPHI
MKQLRLLLLPFSWLYGAVLFIRHFLYDKGFLKSTSFNKPVIVIGNLIIGGAGKSPMTEYLIRRLSDHYHLATLSRGYGRKTKGFIKVDTGSTAEEVGDEPLQFKKKFPDITVADCEDRVKGLKNLLPHHDLCLLDDAFQHRALRAGLAILLFDFSSLKKWKFLIPAGNYRDLFSRRYHADILVVTKSPEVMSDRDREEAMRALRLKKPIPVFFSFIHYSKYIYTLSGERLTIPIGATFLVIVGIANPTSFIDYLRSVGKVSKVLTYRDHYRYVESDVDKIKKNWLMLGADTIIITTEKDAMRLNDPSLGLVLEGLPIYYLPIEIAFHHEVKKMHFDAVLTEKLRKLSK